MHEVLDVVTQDYGPIMLTSTTREKELLASHVGENLADKASCSVLAIAK